MNDLLVSCFPLGCSAVNGPRLYRQVDTPPDVNDSDAASPPLEDAQRALVTWYGDDRAVAEILGEEPSIQSGTHEDDLQSRSLHHNVL